MDNLASEISTYVDDGGWLWILKRPLTAITDLTTIPRTATTATRRPITATRTRPVTAAGAGATATAIGCAERERPARRTDNLDPALVLERRIVLPPAQPTQCPIPTQIPTN